MKFSKYISGYLKNIGVTDVFGIPGGSILDLIYAFHEEEGIEPHLMYHEQAAAFAANGYAQAGKRLGVAYAAKGPGFTNLITGIAEAFYDSVPVVYITAHNHKNNGNGVRTEWNQEMETVRMVSGITKYACRADDIYAAVREFKKCCEIAVTGRMGPAFIDIHADLFQNGDWTEQNETDNTDDRFLDISEAAGINAMLRRSERPVILIGDGVHQTDTEDAMRQFLHNNKVPVISSRFSMDVLNDNPLYFGYIGSHGIRYSNFILAKADMVVAIGNRLACNPKSESFSQVLENKKFISIEIDRAELFRQSRFACTAEADLKQVLGQICFHKKLYQGWITVCDELRKNLYLYDMNEAVTCIAELLSEWKDIDTAVSDVGNHEFWLSRAYVYAKASHRVIFSKSFGALGCGLPKAIGVYYAVKKPVFCFTGDQGIQLNIQELQYIGQHRIPIVIVVMNNHASGMIKDREADRYHGNFLHTTQESGYQTPDFRKVSESFGVNYTKFDDWHRAAGRWQQDMAPWMIEIPLDESVKLAPVLKRGDPCQNLYPYIDRKLYQRLDSL